MKAMNKISRSMVLAALTSCWMLCPFDSALADNRPPRESPTADSRIERPVSDKWAIVIGISKFKDDRIAPLQYAAKDALDLSTFQKQSSYYVRAPVKVTNRRKSV